MELKQLFWSLHHIKHIYVQRFENTRIQNLFQVRQRSVISQHKLVKNRSSNGSPLFV
jgi:hypothetical protein